MLLIWCDDMPIDLEKKILLDGSMSSKSRNSFFHNIYDGISNILSRNNGTNDKFNALIIVNAFTECLDKKDWLHILYISCYYSVGRYKIQFTFMFIYFMILCLYLHYQEVFKRSISIILMNYSELKSKFYDYHNNKLVYIMTSINILLFYFCYSFFINKMMKSETIESELYESKRKEMVRLLQDKIDYRSISSETERYKVGVVLESLVDRFIITIGPMLLNVIQPSFFILFHIVLGFMINGVSNHLNIPQSFKMKDNYKKKKEKSNNIMKSYELANTIKNMATFITNLSIVFEALKVIYFLVNIIPIFLIRYSGVNPIDYAVDLIENKSTIEALNIGNNMVQKMDEASKSRKEIFDDLHKYSSFFLVIYVMCISILGCYFGYILVGLIYPEIKKIKDDFNKDHTQKVTGHIRSFFSIGSLLVIGYNQYQIINKNRNKFNLIIKLEPSIDIFVEKLVTLVDTPVRQEEYGRLDRGFDSVYFNDLNISYQPKGTPIIRLKEDFSLSMGKIYLVVGVSGSGKSTIFNTVRGMSYITKGSIVVTDGIINQDVSKISPSDLNKAIRLVEQKPKYNKNFTVLQFIQGINAIYDKQKWFNLLEIYKLTSANPKEKEKFCLKKMVSLSGGELYRVFMCSMEYSYATMLMIDEGLDSTDLITTANIIMRLILLKDSRIILISTHKILQMIRIINTIIKYLGLGDDIVHILHVDDQTICDYNWNEARKTNKDVEIIRDITGYQATRKEIDSEININSILCDKYKSNLRSLEKK